MAINLTTSAGIVQRTNVYAEAGLLAYAGPQTVLDKFGMNKMMPKNKSDTMVFRRPRVFEEATSPLQEGVTPAARAFGYDDVPVSLQEYGDLGTISNRIEELHEDHVMDDLVQQLGDNVVRTREALCWAVLRAGTSVYYANGAARNAVNTAISLNKQRAVVQGLKRQKAKKHTMVLSGSPSFKTSPIEASYIAVGHTDLEPDIRNMPGFIPCAEYGSKNRVSDYEIGAVEDVRYVLTADLDFFADAGGAASSMRSTSGTSADVYPLVYMGKEAYGVVALRGMGSIPTSIIPVGQKDKSDPLGQRGYAGWRMYHACVRLNELWMTRLEVGATNLG